MSFAQRSSRELRARGSRARARAPRAKQTRLCARPCWLECRARPARSLLLRIMPTARCSPRAPSYWSLTSSGLVLRPARIAVGHMSWRGREESGCIVLVCGAMGRRAVCGWARCARGLWCERCKREPLVRAASVRTFGAWERREARACLVELHRHRRTDAPGRFQEKILLISLPSTPWCVGARKNGEQRVTTLRLAPPELSILSHGVYVERIGSIAEF
jgi:hypothetical protein